MELTDAERRVLISVVEEALEVNTTFAEDLVEEHKPSARTRDKTFEDTMLDVLDYREILTGIKKKLGGE